MILHRAAPCRLAWLVFLACACDWDLQRMVAQERCSPMEASQLFRNGSCNQEPPAGTVRFEQARSTETAARAGGPEGALPPKHVTRAQLEIGRVHFETFCAPCHGLLADGKSQVAENMRYRTPPSLHEPRIRDLADDRIFEVISVGYGFMPAYAHLLRAEERWSVVSYLRVLQLSQNLELTRLPERYREEATRWLR